MKQPAEYLPPPGPTAPSGYILLAHAQQAIARAQADTARYYTLLARAIRNAKAPQT